MAELNTEDREVVADRVPRDGLRLPMGSDALNALQEHPGFQTALAAVRNKERPSADRQLAADALPLGEADAPRLYSIIREAERVLGLRHRARLFQTDSSECNAGSPGTEYPSVLLVGRIAVALDPAALLSVVGHELGHYLTLPAGGIARFRWSISTELKFGETLQEERWLQPQEARRAEEKRIDQLINLSSMECELVADRYAMLTAQNLDAFLRMRMALVAGVESQHIAGSTAQYLSNCQKYVERLRGAGEFSLGESHPEHAVRAYSAWLFSETDVFMSLTGRGSGQLKLPEVNAEIEVLFDRAALHGSWAHEPRASAAARANSSEAMRRAPQPSADTHDDNDGTEQALTWSKSVDVVSKEARSALGSATDHLRAAANRTMVSVERGDHARAIDSVKGTLRRLFRSQDSE